MSNKIERTNTGVGFFTVIATGRLQIYKIYKKNIDGTFQDVYGSPFEMKNNSIRINVSGYDKMIVVYDKIDSLATIEISDVSSDYSGFYTMTFISRGLKNKTLTVDAAIENPGNLNISASVSVSISGKTEIFEYPIFGEYVVTSSKDNIPVSHNTFTDKDKIENQNFSIYIPESKKETQELIFDRNTIENKTDSPITVMVEIRVFSVSGKMDVSPVIKRVRIIKDGNY